eukprot:COSAG05_NODE_11842_length_493_cov_2.718274_2_plen_32_part_01
MPVASVDAPARRLRPLTRRLASLRSHVVAAEA